MFAFLCLHPCVLSEGITPFTAYSNGIDKSSAHVIPDRISGERILFTAYPNGDDRSSAHVNPSTISRETTILQIWALGMTRVVLTSSEE